MRVDGAKILADMRANQAKLNACPAPHDFVCIEPDRPLGGKHQCSRCGGTTSPVNVHWYQTGLEHGKAAARGQR